MASIAQAPAPSRKQFRLSRHRSNEVARAARQPTVKPSGGSRQTRPFDPSELSRRLEIYQQDQKLAQARRQIADETEEATSPQDRTDSAHDEDDKPDTSSLEEEEEEVEAVVIAEVQPQPRPEFARQRSRPRHERKVSSSRTRRNAPGTYFPRYAAKQFSATTHSVPEKPAKKGETSRRKEAADFPKPKHTYDNTNMPKPVERVVASEADLATFNDRRCSAFVSTDRPVSHNPRTTRPRPLSTALEDLTIHNNETNPYMLAQRRLDQSHLNDYSSAAQHMSKDQRPPLTYQDHDRHDWSQASQCGDSARQSLHLHSMWRKDIPADSKQPPRRWHSDAKQRGKSHGDMPENQSMISDAVKLVKEDRRKSSLLGFLKRHH